MAPGFESKAQAPGQAVSPALGAGGGASPTAPVRLAVEARFVEFFLGNDNVAVVKKQPIEIKIRTSWKLRASMIRWTSPFSLRGGVKLLNLPEPQIVREGYKVYQVSAIRQLRYGRVMLVKKEGVAVDEDGDTLYTWHPVVEREVVATGWLVFELNDDAREAKLVPDATPTHVLLVWEHHLSSLSYRPAIVYSPALKQYVVYENWLSEYSLLVAIVPVGLKFRACFNRINARRDPYYYYECYEFTTNAKTILEQKLIGEFEREMVSGVVGHTT
jgi:hypothetical protein